MKRTDYEIVIDMAKTLRDAADQFDFYAREHRRKGAHEKAVTNEQWATRLREAANTDRDWM